MEQHEARARAQVTERVVASIARHVTRHGALRINPLDLSVLNIETREVAVEVGLDSSVSYNVIDAATGVVSDVRSAFPLTGTLSMARVDAMIKARELHAKAAVEATIMWCSFRQAAAMVGSNVLKLFTPPKP